MKKREYFIEQIEAIGNERLNGERLKEQSLEINQTIETSPSFRFKDFTLHFKNENELLKKMGRQANCRLKQLAGLVGWLDSWLPKTQKSQKLDVKIDENPESRVLESPLFNEHPTTTYTASYPYTICCQSGLVDYEQLPPIIYLSHTSSRLLSIYRTSSIIKNVFKYARECGLIQCVDNSFRSRTWKDGSHVVAAHSKKYAVNTVTLVQLKTLMKERGIVVPTKFNESSAPAEKSALKKEHHQEELYYKVRLGKCMKTPGLSEREVADILSYKYQDVLYPMLARLEKYNENRPEEQRMNFSFNIRFDKCGYNIKNGCRAWSLAGLKPTEEKALFTDKEKFEEYFSREFGSKPWEYDVHSSVFKINRAFNKGVWDEQNSDGYREMFPDVNRKVAKNIAMVYMFEFSGKKIDAAIAHTCPEYAAEHKDEIDLVMRHWYGHVYNYMGESLGNLVFLLEDSFYSTVDMALKKRGYKFIRKFDCWCFPSDCHPENNEMEKIMSRCFRTWYDLEAAPLKARLNKLENSGVRELKRLYDIEHPTTTYTASYPYTICCQTRAAESLQMKTKKKQSWKDNSDIPEELKSSLEIIADELKNKYARLSVLDDIHKQLSGDEILTALGI